MLKNLFVLILFLPLTLLSLERPIITDVQPKSFIQHEGGLSDTRHKLTIFGNDLWPKDITKYPYTKERVKVLLRAQGGYELIPNPIRRTVGNNQTLTINFSGKKWLKKKGTLQVIVKVEDMASPPYTMDILPMPTSPPSVTSVTPQTFIIFLELPPSTNAQDNYRLQIRGHNFDALHTMSLLIQGRKTPIIKGEIKEGTLECILPPSLWNIPGRYSVKLYGRKGASRTQWITIEAQEIQKKSEP